MRTSIRITSGISSWASVDHLDAVGGLADELEVRLLVEHHLQPAAEQRVVVAHQHPEPSRTASVALCAPGLPCSLGVRSTSRSACSGRHLRGFYAIAPGISRARRFS